MIDEKIQKDSLGRNRTSFLGLLDPCPNQCTTRDYIYYSIISIILFYMIFIIVMYINMNKIYCNKIIQI